MGNELTFSEAKRLAYWRMCHPLLVSIRRTVGKLRSYSNTFRTNSAGGAISLELGSPRRAELAEWMFSDWAGYGDFAFDLSKRIPLADRTVNRIYMSHVLEHFSYPEPMMGLLRECHRLLVPGGTLRVAVPDARIFVAAYRNPNDFDRDKYCSWDVGLDFESPINYLNFVAHLGGEHKHIFDPLELNRVLRLGGFSSADQVDFDPSVDLKRRQHESIYATGIK